MKVGVFFDPQITQLFEDRDTKQNYVLQKEEPERHLETLTETF